MAFRRPCGRPFANQQALQQHFNASIHAQIYICQEHDRKFGSQQALEQHLDSPAHAPVYECVNCNRQFGSQRALDQHLDSPAHVPVYECIKCNRKFGSQQALDQHLNSSAHLLQCGEHGRPWGKKEGLESSRYGAIILDRICSQIFVSLINLHSVHSINICAHRISPCDTKEPPTKRLVSDHWDPIHWELGYQLRDSYEISQTPQIVQDLPSHTTNTSSLKPGFTEYSGNLEPLRGKIPPLDLDTVNYSGTVISYSPKLMLVLQSFIQSRDILRKNGYIVERLSESDLDGKKRCRGCGKCECALCTSSLCGISK
jgi:DNA-directed RNA polymerase subunit RPC12/RpoP